MATKSILKEIHLENENQCRGFAIALETALDKQSKKVNSPKTCITVPKEKIKNFFVKNKNI